VDATFDPGASYVPRAMTDDYRCFILPPAFTPETATNLVGFDIEPGTRHQVHHVILFAAPATDAQNRDAVEPQLGWPCFGGTDIPNTTPKMLGGWAPGGGATLYPSDTGIPLEDGEVIVMQVHYSTNAGAPVADLTRAKLQYAASVTYPAVIIPAIHDTFSIPPDTSGYTDGHEQPIPGFSFLTFRLWGVTPHMHQLGRRIRVIRKYTVSQQQQQQCLIDIPSWDFHWQQSYEYAAPVTVRGGDVIRIECTWDNPSSVPVTWGERTVDEMCIAFFYVTS
jgi:hypothetical protein